MSTETVLEDLNFGWKRRTFLNHRQGKIHRSYLYKGRHKGVKVNIKTLKGEQARSLFLHDKDLRDAKEWLNEVQNVYSEHKIIAQVGETSRDYILAKGLFKAALVNYQKVFGESDDRRIKLNRNQLPEKLREDHDEYVRIRHNYIAHGGKSDLELCDVFIAMPPAKKYRSGADSIPHIGRDLHQAVVVEHEELEDLIEAAQKIIAKKMAKLQNLIMEELSTIKADILYRRVGNKMEFDLTEKEFLILKSRSAKSKKGAGLFDFFVNG